MQKELDDLFAELDQLLKSPEIQAELSSLGVNSSLAIVAAEGLRAYLGGDKDRAAEDFSTVGEEIAHRSRMSKASKPS